MAIGEPLTLYTMRNPVLISMSLASVFATTAPSQCVLQWVPGDGIPGVDGTVSAVIEWDRDGTGPLPRLNVVAGYFTVAGSVAANNIAAFDPVGGTWSALGGGTNDSVLALAVLPNGELVAGGSFTSAGGVAVTRIASWNGTTWSALGSSPFNSTVQGMTTLANGDLVATGPAGFALGQVARWDGASWSLLGIGGLIESMAALTNGDLVVGSRYFATTSVQRWNGATWSAIGPALMDGSYNGSVARLVELPNGDLVAAGRFDRGGPAALSNVALWNGTAWSTLGAGSPTALSTLTRLPSGLLWAGGSSAAAGYVLRQWDGTAWSSLPWDNNQYISCLHASASGDVIAGGSILVAGGAGVRNVARWNGSAWTAMGSGTNGVVRGVLALPGGDVLAYGDFTLIHGVAANRVARWNGSAWSALGGGITSGYVSCATALANGDIVVGGWFGGANGMIPCVARWNGATWSPMGAFYGEALALVTMPNGDVVAGGNLWNFTVRFVARWDGSTWLPLGSGLDGDVYDLLVMPNGDLVAGGTFSTAGGVAALGIARWDGAAWHPLGSGVTGGRVEGLASAANGDVIAAGSFTTAGGVSAPLVARWNGTSWSAVGTALNGNAWSVLTLPNGDLAVHGYFWSPVTCTLVRWNGSTWSVLGPNLTAGTVRGLAMMPDGSLAVGGGSGFVANGVPLGSYLVHLETTCAPAVTIGGPGCSGSSGPNQLASSMLPWAGATWSTVGTGLPPSALICAVVGFAPTSLPLASVVGTALPGCVLHANTDLVTLQSASGTATWQLALPNTASLGGFVLHHQMLSLAFPTLEVTATNSLVVTVGSF